MPDIIFGGETDISTLGPGLVALAFQPGSPRVSQLMDKLWTLEPSYGTLLKILVALRDNQNDVIGQCTALDAVWADLHSNPLAEAPAPPPA